MGFRALVFVVLVVSSFALRASEGKPVVSTAQSSESPAVLTELQRAFTAAYNLDHDQAIAHARRAVALGPESSRAHRGLASILWLHMLFERGAVSVDTYLGNITKFQATLPKPNQAEAEEFKRVVARAIDLANARLKVNPRDVQATFDAGAAYGIQASYVASVEGSMMSAFGIAKRAFSAQEDVLERDPSRVGAGLIVGTYRYLVSTFNLATRVVAYVVGFGGGRRKASPCSKPPSRIRRPGWTRRLP
jgi:hypothetical protein